MKTIAKQINWDFKTNGDLEIRDKNGKIIYSEDSAGVWVKIVRVSGEGFLEKTKNKTTRSRNIFWKLYKCITKLFTYSYKY